LRSVENEHGQDALAKFIPGGFDCIIISDLQMPRLDVIGLLKKIRLQDEKVTFLMITGFPTEVRATEAIKVGANDLYRSPFRWKLCD
jgi:DNA-binding NtrC family response regulator